MDTFKAMALARAASARGDRMRVFDWDRAARLIRERCVGEAVAGLKGDFEWTAGTIAINGDPVKDDYTYLASNHAAPMLVLNGEAMECWVYQDESPFRSDTKWPESALAILVGRTP